MSFIHFSPLFVPLEPLPIMSPEVMRSQRKKSNSSKNSPSSKASPSTKTRGSPSSITKGKKPATSPPALYPSPEMHFSAQQTYGPSVPEPSLLTPYPETLPDADAIMVQALTAEPEQVSTQLISYPEGTEAQTDELQPSSFGEGSFDSRAQAALTFTIESQPMSDLSSSQQIE